MPRMVDKIVVVTGAAQGIGAAIARKFAEEGATLILVDFDAARLEHTADQLPGGKPLSIVADVTEETAVEDAFLRITARFGRIDVLINNVGGARNAKLWEMTRMRGTTRSGSISARRFFAHERLHGR
jgi:NAD(P)-dependent dehydrogenase (short-subunit alcohol dehydrogenase family)